MSSSKTFLYFCLSFVGGIFLSSFFQFNQVALLAFLILGLIFISVLFKYKKSVLFGFCIIFLVLGIWRHQAAENKISESTARIYGSQNEVIFLEGKVIEEPVAAGKVVKLIVKTASGKILITTNKYPEYHYGDVLKINGKLETPAEDIKGFSYKDYLKKDGIVALINWPEIEKSGSDANPVLSALFSLKNKLKESVNQLMPSPQSGLMEALFFGDEENIPQALRDKFNVVGIRHITAVSGMNITIISALLLNLLLFLGLNRRQAFYFSIALIAFYILMIGAPPSALRAGLMGCLLLFAQHCGRMASAPRLIVFAATLMLSANPFLLKLDVGFQLSFLAIMGLIYLQPVLANFLRKMPDFFQMRYALSATLAAQVFTLPVLIFSFGRLSLISPLANVLIVPLISFITVLGFVSAVLGIIFLPLGWLFSMPLWFLLAYIIKLVDYFSGLSFASITFGKVFWLWPVIFYSVLLYFMRRWQEKERLKILKN